MQFAKYISVILASTLKFFAGPLAGLAFELSWVETAVCTVLGMMLSVLVVSFAGELLFRLSQRFRRTPPRRFTRQTRLAVKIWKRAGVLGIAFLTPLLLTPIGGTALAVSFRVERPRLFMAMLASAVFWAVIQTLLVYQMPGVFTK
ncbi:hypothetical protein F5984_22975 [Rudanella paleaurantiibacter]|uniref:Small multi-drug export protein n=1 Tax=Rudanella paleaurantiibacter TaxID=2614655 RepID=A0A7J5TTL9_9BACT|nr:hypothetical protein [Rudanella paleaurantiibacter]KAB7727100.1 hypothetical protein F5984_22975 [Rudanella paleaurantiibacter]